MPTPAATSQLDARVRELTAALLTSLQNLWGNVPRTSITGGWSMIAAQVVAQMAATQIAAARDGAAYVPDVLNELDISSAAEGSVVPESFVVGMSSGMPLDRVLGSVPLRALRVASDAGVDEGLDAGWNLLEGIAETQVADSARQASSARMTATRAVHGYVRMVEPGACSRCIVLAGKFYRWNKGFLRHDRCRCYHIPSDEFIPGDRLGDPDAYFRSLSRADQDKAFTKAGAQAIRDGADISRVVNARRGALGLSPAGPRLTEAQAREFRNGNQTFGHLRTTRVFGQDVYVTTEATTFTRGIGSTLKGAPRLLPESVYQIAGNDRDMAIALLKRFGYLR